VYDPDKKHNVSRQQLKNSYHTNLFTAVRLQLETIVPTTFVVCNMLKCKPHLVITLKKFYRIYQITAWLVVRTLTSESIDIETETETESLTESQPSSSGIENNDGNRIQLISKQNTTSKVWDYFGFVPGNPTGFDTPTCKVCFNKVTAKWSNTSNLTSHL